MSIAKTDRRTVLRALATMVAAETLGLTAHATQPGSGNTPARATRMWDVIVVGAGVFGAWTAWQLRQLGSRVLLVDAWGPGHPNSSSGGESRLIRTEYGGDELYTSMAWESLQAWQGLSSRAGLPIFFPIGALYLYKRDHPQIATSLALHERLGIPMQKLGRRQLAQCYPQLRVDDIEVAILQPTMGALAARRAVQTLVAQFLEAGGEYAQVAIERPHGAAALDALTASDGSTLRAERYVFACGAWLPKLFPDVIGRRIVPTRQDVFFFGPQAGDSRFDAARLPAWVDADDEALHYGFPALESRGFKVALDVQGPDFDPDTGERQVGPAAVADVRKYLAHRFPALAQRPLIETRVCQYENSASGDFLIDRHPQWANAWLVGGGSGHGYKHGPAVGRYTAELVTGRLMRPQPRFRYAQHAPRAAS